VNRSTNPLEQARQTKRLNGSGGQAEGSLPKGPTKAEAELLSAYDLMESKVRKLPANLQWRQIQIRRTDQGLAVSVTV
jgi:hypothetical protein